MLPTSRHAIQTYPPISLPAEFGLCFCTTLVCVGFASEQLAVPHSYPLGQQFPPTLAAQLIHPLAHTPVGLADVAALPTGTTIVAPALMIVVSLAGGQDVGWQSRPCRQHPPS